MKSKEKSAFSGQFFVVNKIIHMIAVDKANDTMDKANDTMDKAMMHTSPYATEFGQSILR